MKEILCSLPRNMKAFELTTADTSEDLYQQYCCIRDYHYIERNHWETASNDTYDRHSTVLVLVDDDTVIVGCRIIKDSPEASLPIRNVLNSHNKPTGQVPNGSVELSRFVIHPELLGKKAVRVYMHHFIQVAITYNAKTGYPAMFAVLISILEKCFSRNPSVTVERLPDGISDNHGHNEFYTVRLCPN